MKIISRLNNWKKIASSWIELWKIQKEWQKKEKKDFAQRVSGIIVDVGCAAGLEKDLLKDNRNEYIGIDFCKEMMIFNDNKIIADARLLPLKTESIDGIWCCSLLKHLLRSEAQKVVKEIERILKKGSYAWIGFDIGKGQRIEKRNNLKFIINLYTEEEARMLLRNFEIISIEKETDWANFLNIICRKNIKC